MIMSLLLQVGQGFAPGDCIFTGLCGIQAASTGPPSGLMFAALGFIGVGLIGLRIRKR